jgi:hypothetical protein
MSRADKLLKRFLSKPRDFTYDELRKLLAGLGYEETFSGRTSGSRVSFVNRSTMHIIKIHMPHPAHEMKRYQLDDLEESLRGKGVIS